MRQVSLQEVKQLARQAYHPLWDGARSLGRDVKLYCHWTAGRYFQLFTDYHILITGDGKVFVSTNDLSETLKRKLICAIQVVSLLRYVVR